MIRVVSALILRDSGMFLQKRPPTALRPDLWENPGGKVEPGETDQEALAREIMEELRSTSEIGEHVSSCTFHWQDEVQLELYHAKVFDAPDDGIWVTPDVAIDSYPLVPSAYLWYRDIKNFRDKIRRLDPMDRRKFYS